LIISADQALSFRKIIYDYYKNNGRKFPWRETYNPYHILISEIMLQQTQVERVLEKYPVFINIFPDFWALVHADFKDVLKAWLGLGYNRRAFLLKTLAGTIIQDFDGRLPSNTNDLLRLPGIGKATAGAILAFAFNIPSAFIETNIRRVFIHHFFQNIIAISDSTILPLVEQTLDNQDPRAWYYALMDYGSMLRKYIPNPNRRSSHYQKQTPFKYSDRKIRGEVLRMLIQKQYISEDEAYASGENDTERIKKILIQMQKEGLIREQDSLYSLT
jgi:A/G-specific adenine glycosylase